jgi:ADP-dependent NAD(P)H-hydrate dehydratase / NAD(P)H-hydrate epimerase
MIELLNTTEMAEADRLAITGGIPGITLMENAGRAVADCVAQRHPPGTKLVVVAGPGNNGGDGFVAARLLAEQGFRMRLLLVGSRDRLKGDAAEAARRWPQAVEEFKPEKLIGAGVVIDALFGTGLDRALEGEPRRVIEAINASGAPVLAVDLPSGINGSSGAVMGAAIIAGRTIAFFRRKPGHVLLPGRVHCGALTVADIGIPAGVLGKIQPRTFLNVPELWKTCFPLPHIAGHKYGRGDAVVVSGGIAHTGAARLAARGALRAGTGLVTIASPKEALALNAAASTAVMVRPVDGAAEFGSLLADRRINTLVLGPGGGIGEGMRAMVQAALASDRAVVLDADALTSFADQPQVLFDAIAARGSAVTVLTPHEGEFARLFQDGNQEIGNTSKLHRARAAAKCSGGIVLLKGPDTVGAAPDGRAAIATNAPAWLATAGAGDVLAGFVAGLLAQGMPAFEGAAAAVWLHGQAGNEAGPGLIAEDLPEALPRIYRRLLRELSLES